MGSKMGHGYATRTNQYQFGNFDFGQTRMAGDAFSPNSDFMQGQRDFVQDQQESDKNPNQNSSYDWTPNSPQYHTTDVTTNANYNDITHQGNTYNYGDGPSSGDTTYTWTSETDIDQSSQQDANAETNFGNVDTDVSNNQMGDFSEINVFANQYGGDNKAFNITYQGEGAQMKATPMRDMTMAGMFEVSDSPAKTAGFMKKYGDLNRANQADYANTGVSTAQKYINQGAANKVVDIGALDQQIRTSPLYHRDMSRIEGAYTFGDRYAQGGSQPNWQYDPQPDKDYGIDPIIKDNVFGNNDDDD